MLSWFTKKSSNPSAVASSAAKPKVAVAVVAPHALRPAGVPIYPPMDGGLAIVDARELVATQSESIQLLRRHVALPPDVFERKYLGPITRLADFIGLLPASRTKHHSGAGGLFRFALEMGVHSARTADGVMFAANEQFERRRDAEVAWRHAAFLTAICSELYRPLIEMQVVDADGDVWGPYLAGLNQWARSRHAKQVYVRWISRDSEPPGVRAVAGYAMNSIAGDELLNQLHSVNPTIVHAMVGTVTGTMTALDNHPLQRVISTVRAKIIEQDQARSTTLYGNLTQGAHLEPYLLDGMRQLLASGKWAINGKNARMHYGRDGLHLVWPVGAKELLEYLREKGVEAIPANHVTLGEVLLSSGIVEPAGDGQPWHMVYPSTASDRTANRILTVRFKRPKSLIPSELEDVAPVDWKLSVGPEASGAPSQVQPSAGAAAEAISTPKVAAPADAELAKGLIAPQPNAIDAAAPPTASGAGSSMVAAGVSAIEAATPEAPPTKEGRKRAPRTKGAEAVPAPEEVVDRETGEILPGGAVPESEAPEPPPAATTGTQPAAPAPARERRQGAIPERPARKTDISSIPPEFISLLGVDLVGEIVNWRNAWNGGRSSRHFMVVQAGLAVTVEFIMLNTVLDVTKVIEPLKSSGLIEMREEGGRVRPTHRLQFPEAGLQMSYILKRSFVTRCGFTMDT
jgi:conjugal transfer pilus assembly protein TraI